MEFGLWAGRDATRYCYLRLGVLESLLKDERVLNALMETLEVPGKKTALAKLSATEKVAAIDRQIAHFQSTPTSIWYNVEAGEVLAASVWSSDLPDKIVLDAFGDVKAESDLCVPVLRWIASSDLQAYAEVPLGRYRVDVLGYRRSGFFTSERIVSVELKNDLEQFKRALDQLATFRDYSTCVYLACTPSLAAQYLEKHADARNVRHWDPQALTRKLEPLGVGLLLVEREQVFEYIRPREAKVEKRFAVELADALANMKPRM